ncbi:MAG: hypothetical protein RIQ62_1958 [Bacteroidota bacterium]
MKKLIAFDLDGTLADSKSAMNDGMAAQFADLLNTFQVCVITGGKVDQFNKQLLDNLQASSQQLKRLHLMPTCGTRYMTYNVVSRGWDEVYAEDFSEDEKQEIIKALEKGVYELGYEEKKPYGDVIEDRGSQVTFSALGQDIVDVLGKKGVEIKEAWDSDGSKKLKLRNYVADLLPDFEVRAGGATSIDITKPGIDKAYGMRKLMALLEIDKSDILFMGDKLSEGGNDYPVKAMGIDSIEVSRWQDTAVALTAILHVL